MKSRLFHVRTRKTGLPPGSLVYTGERSPGTVTVHLFDYNEQGFEEKSIVDIHEVFGCRDTDTVSWINVNGLQDAALIESLGTHFGIHPLILEDILNTRQRPKLEQMENGLFMVVRMLTVKGDSHRLDGEQVSLILTPHAVLTFQEKEGDVFDPIRERIRSGLGRIRRMGPDYLAYALLDTLVDHIFEVIERLGEDMEALEEVTLTDPDHGTMENLQDMKRRLLFLRKSVWPLREVVSSLERNESTLIRKATRPYLRDVYDHSIQIIDMLETMRDFNAGLFDLYLSSVSNRMNEVMKVLTVIATLFIPLTFIAGIYGMNFQFMPELGWRWAYPVFWAVILVLVSGMVFYFRRKKWL